MNLGSSDLLDFTKIWNVRSTDLLTVVTNIVGNGSFNGNNQGDVVVPPAYPI